MNSFREYITKHESTSRVQPCSSGMVVQKKFANPNAVFGDTLERQQSVRAKKLKLDFGMRGAAL